MKPIYFRWGFLSIIIITLFALARWLSPPHSLFTQENQITTPPPNTLAESYSHKSTLNKSSPDQNNPHANPAQKKKSTNLLIQSLHKHPIDIQTAQTNPPLILKKILSRKNHLKSIIRAYHQDHNDANFRVQMIFILEYILRKGSITAEDRKIAEECIRLSLKDSAPMVRGKAVYSLLFTSNNRQYQEDVRPLLTDTDIDVQVKARYTGNRLDMKF